MKRSVINSPQPEQSVERGVFPTEDGFNPVWPPPTPPPPMAAGGSTCKNISHQVSCWHIIEPIFESECAVLSASLTTINEKLGRGPSIAHHCYNPPWWSSRLGWPETLTQGKQWITFPLQRTIYLDKRCVSGSAALCTIGPSYPGGTRWRRGWGTRGPQRPSQVWLCVIVIKIGLATVVIIGGSRGILIIDRHRHDEPFLHWLLLLK